MSTGSSTWQRKKPHLPRIQPTPPISRPMGLESWREALQACLENWPAQKSDYLELWASPPNLIGDQTIGTWRASVDSCLALDAQAGQEQTLKALLEPPRYELSLSRNDAQHPEVRLNGNKVELEQDGFECLYALADLQRQEPHALQSSKQIYQHVMELFDKPDSGRINEKAHRQAFTELLDALLDKLNVNADPASAGRWRSLLTSQAMRYASGLDDAENFKLNSELQQHRDLLTLLVRRYEQDKGLPPLDSPAARLYRFFVTDPEPLEIRYRLNGFVAKLMDKVHHQLRQAQLAISADGCPQEILWGETTVSPWQEATLKGYALHTAVKLCLMN